ncbi:hypothetical protein GCM10007304_39920 [Rhodococcoides trifolii]|uniref:Uncharacterized protein n=1 Tax=Rhodococcoides trifolii TaxID=908250 RepID=A0A917G4B8_9NOCA|nr:hypothetical protein [Rhodococcus trifolii]GGG22116.1 hypothetical protein GCM10007304_39920 [Rhodococcus trifolii]
MNRSVVALFAVAGVLFLAYPVVRPYSDETGLEGARAFASNQWVPAHLFAMLGFIAAASAVAAIGSRVTGVTMLLGTGLVLPYYGAEAFSLHAIGTRALSESDLNLMSLADPIRYGAVQATMFAAGLVLLAVGAVSLAVSTWSRWRWFTIPFAAGFVLFLPQFYGPPPVRIAHGVLMLLGCALVAYRAARTDFARSTRPVILSA